MNSALAGLVHREVTAEEVRAAVEGELSRAERDGVLELVRWFTTRYPTAEERLAYVRQAYRRWERTAAARQAASIIDVRQVRAAGDEVRGLIEELDRELHQHYAPEQRHGLSLAQIFAPHVRFFMAFVSAPGQAAEPVAAGCGGVAGAQGFAEIKRMYVRPAFRGRGVADAILARLECEAARLGYDLVRLETGVHQRAALRFYVRSGYVACDAFPPYSSMPAEAISTSVFLEKRLPR